MNPPVKILLLGATGSIGQQTIDVIDQHPDRFELIGAAAGSKQNELEAILASHPSIQAATLASLDADRPQTLEEVPVYGGEEGMLRLVRDLDYDLLVNAVVGFRGLEPTLLALERGKDVALANKESMVCGGQLVTQAARATGASIFPIDSEHSAIDQCLQGSDHDAIARLIITASGGSLRDLTRQELETVTVERAMAHPSWKMGPRITIDSATMVNKGFEVIEAHYLFDIPFERISTVLHPQSLVHSMVEFQDHAILAQLGSADMRLPIQFALFHSHGLPLNEDHPLDMASTLSLDFRQMDFGRYPILKTVIEAGKKGGNAGCVVNAADEQAVSLFLQGAIPFLAIEEAIVRSLQTIPFIESPTLEDLKRTDEMTREYVSKLYL